MSSSYTCLSGQHQGLSLSRSGFLPLLGVCCLLCQSLFAQEAKPQKWKGILDVGAAKLTIHIEIEDNGKKANLYVVEQGNNKIPIDDIKLTERTLTLDMKSLKASFQGDFDASGKVCKGTFTQHGASFDLELKRVDSFSESEGKLIEFWKGSLDYAGTEMEMGLKIFEMPNGKLAAKLSSYSQGVTDLPVDFKREGNQYDVKFPAARLAYSGELNNAKDQLEGTIRQAGTENELIFHKADFDDAPVYNRPQTPVEPFPYDSEDVSYENSTHGIKLAGTLTVPKGDGPFPAAITISGSGATDRDGTHFEHKPYQVIADYLTRNGIAVLRFDDRGVGQSTGNHSAATSADFAVDVTAGIEFLKSHSKIDPNKIGLIGHSEGGLIAPMVAAENEEVHFIILLAGTGVDGGVILKSQSSAILKADGASEEKLAANRKAHDAILERLKESPDITHADIKAAGQTYIDSIADPSTKELCEVSVNQLVSVLGSKWVRYFVQHDPAKPLTKVKCHVLAMNGEKDLQVLCDLNLDPIEKALQRGTPASFQVIRLANMNHMFQETKGSGSPADYGKIEETVSPKALKVISDWIAQVTN